LNSTKKSIFKKKNSIDFTSSVSSKDEPKYQSKTKDNLFGGYKEIPGTSNKTKVKSF